MIRQIQKRWAELEDKTLDVIASEFTISLPTAKKYTSMTEEDITALNYRTVYKKRKTAVDDYMNIIYKMLYDKVDPAIIISYIFMLDYSGKIDTLRIKIERIARNNFNRIVGRMSAYRLDYPKDVSVIKRGEILRYITTKNPKLKRSETIDKYIDIIKEKYPAVAVLENIYNDFHEIIMGKDADRLNAFLKKYETSVVKGFIDCIKDDVAPVMNAISSDISSGFVEGNNNKFKLIKRILYGRASSTTLFKKSYIAFCFSRNNFDFSLFI